MKREAELKLQFGEEMRRLLPGFEVVQLLTPGAPDRLVAGNGRMTCWEFKHATPDFGSPGLQELTCCRLAASGHCRYVVWWERNGVGHKTMVVHPMAIFQRRGGSYPAEAWCPGFNHKWLVEQVRKAHAL